MIIRLTSLLVVALLWAALPALADGPGVSFVTRSAACAAGDKVLFGEIARPLGAVPPETWQKMAAIPLWPAPEREGRVQNVSVSDVRAALGQALGNLAAGVAVTGSISVQRGGAVVTREDVESFLVESLTPRLAALGGEATVRDVSAPQTVFLPADFSGLSLDPGEKLSPGRLTLHLVALGADGRNLRAIPVSLFVDLWLAVPCAARPLNVGEVVKPQDVTFESKNAAYLRGGLWDGRSGPWRMKRPTGQGQVLYADSLEVVPLIKKGDRVTLEYHGEAIRLTAQGEALSDGGAGQKIMVKNLQFGRQVLATVKDATTVVVR